MSYYILCDEYLILRFDCKLFKVRLRVNLLVSLSRESGKFNAMCCRLCETISGGYKKICVVGRV